MSLSAGHKQSETERMYYLCCCWCALQGALYPESNAEIIAQAKTRLHKAISEQKRLGWDLTRSWIMGNLFVEGMQKVEITSPVEDIEIAENECVAIDLIELTLKDRRW